MSSDSPLEYRQFFCRASPGSAYGVFVSCFVLKESFWCWPLRRTRPLQRRITFGQALDWTRQQGVLSLELRSATSLARLWQQQGRGTEAYELLTPVYDRFSEGFETADLRAAKALIDEVRVRPVELSAAPSVQEIAGRYRATHPRTNLPEPISEPIGRATELSEVPDLIRRHRLVTLIGGGRGSRRPITGVR